MSFIASATGLRTKLGLVKPLMNFIVHSHDGQNEEHGHDDDFTFVGGGNEKKTCLTRK